MAVAPCKRLVLKPFPDLLVPILTGVLKFRQCWVLGCWPRLMNPGGGSSCGSNSCFTMQIEFENKFSQIGERGGGNDWHEFARSSRNLAGHLLAAEMDDMKPFARSLRRRGFVAQDVRSFLCVFCRSSFNHPASLPRGAFWAATDAGFGADSFSPIRMDHRRNAPHASR